DRQRTLVAGCDGYIQQPIDVDAFPRQVADFLGGKRERVESHDEGVYLRELNQRLVYRLLNQVEELKRLNQHFVRRASQLEDLHHSMQDITSELGVAGMLEKLLGGLSQAIGSTSLTVELSEPPGIQVAVRRDTGAQPRSVLAGTGAQPPDDWPEAEGKLPPSRPGPPRTPTETVEHGEDDDEGLSGWIVKHRKLLAHSDVLPQPSVKSTAWLADEGLVSFLGLPLFLESELVGILTILYRQRHVFTP